MSFTDDMRALYQKHQLITEYVRAKHPELTDEEVHEVVTMGLIKAAKGE